MNPIENHLLRTRRDFLATSTSGLGGVALASLLAEEGLLATPSTTGFQNPMAPRQPHFHAKAKACIFIFMAGAPSQVDLFDPKPKLNEMTGQSLPANAGEDSLSFYAVLKGARENSVAPRVAMVHHGMQGRFALREQYWKLVMEDARKGKRELYNLAKDPGETTNVIAQHPEVAARLVAKLTSIVRNGRSSPGPVQKNDTPPWKELIWMH